MLWCAHAVVDKINLFLTEEESLLEKINKSGWLVGYLL